MNINELEALRKKKLLKVILMDITGIILMILGLTTFMNKQKFGLLDTLVVVGAVVLFVLAQNQSKYFENTVKETCINDIIANILNGRGKLEWDKQYNPESKQEMPSVYDKFLKDLAQLSNSPEEFLKANKALSERHNKELDEVIKESVKNNSDGINEELLTRHSNENTELYRRFGISESAAEDLTNRYKPEFDEQSKQHEKEFAAFNRNIGAVLDPSKNLLRSSKLFKNGILTIDDVFAGEYKGISTVITEAALTAGRNNTELFKGFCLSLVPQKSFAGHTVIGKKGHIETKGLRKLELPKSLFSKKYDVFTDNINEASQILVPELTNFLANSKKPIFLACYADNIIVAVEQNADLFKLGSLFKNVNDPQQYMKFAENFNLALSVIDRLIAISSLNCDSTLKEAPTI